MKQTQNDLSLISQEVFNLADKAAQIEQKLSDKKRGVNISDEEIKQDKYDLKLQILKQKFELDKIALRLDII